MTTRILDAELVIRGRADSSSAKALDDTIQRVQSAAKSVDNFRKAQERFAGARTRFNEAQKSVTSMARAMAATDRPTKQLEANYKAAQRAVQQASKSFEAQKAVLIGAKHELDGYGLSVSRLASEQAKLKEESDHASSALARQGRLAERAHRVRGIGSALGAFTTGRAGRDVARDTIKATTEGEHERTRMIAAGMTPEETAEAERISAELTRKYLSVPQTKVLHLLRNARAVTGSFEEAGHLMDPLLGAYVTAMGAHPERKSELDEDFDKLIKSEEMVGATQDIPRFRENMNLISKALNVFGDTLMPGEFYNFAKYARGAGPSYNDDFLLGIAPTFMQEMGGKSAGEAMASFHAQFVGGHMTQPAARMLDRYGLIHKDKIEYTKAGLLKRVEAGALVEGELAKKNPYAWIQTVLLPAMATAGVTSKEDIENAGAVLASKRTTGHALGIFATQQKRIEKDVDMEHHAMGSEAAALFQNRDPYVALASVTAQFNNLLQAAGSPLAEPAATALNHIAGGLNALTEAAREHPKAASGGLLASLGAAGAVAYQGTLSAAARFGIISPNTAARWGVGALAGSPLGVATAIGTGGAILSYNAASTVRDNPKAFADLVDNPMLGALGGDYALAQAILHPPEPKPQELKVNIEVAPADGFWARVTSIFRSGDDEKHAVTSTGSVGKSMPEAGSFDGVQP